MASKKKLDQKKRARSPSVEGKDKAKTGKRATSLASKKKQKQEKVREVDVGSIHFDDGSDREQKTELKEEKKNKSSVEELHWCADAKIGAFSVGDVVWLRGEEARKSLVELVPSCADETCPDWPCQIESKDVSSCTVELLGNIQNSSNVRALFQDLRPFTGGMKELNQKPSESLEALFQTALEMISKLNNDSESDDEPPPPMASFHRANITSKISNEKPVSQRKLQTWLDQSARKNVVWDRGTVVLMREIGYGEGIFQPGIIKDILPCDSGQKYRVQFWDGTFKLLTGSEFLAPGDADYTNAKIPPEIYDLENGLPSDEKDILEEDLQAVLGDLKHIHEGLDSSSDRYRDFIAGGKSRKALAHRVNRGPLQNDEYQYLTHRLHDIFVRSSQINMGDERQTASMNESSRRIWTTQLVQAVLLAEAVIRIIQSRDACSYSDAEHKMMSGQHEDDWLLRFLAERALPIMSQNTQI